MGQLWVREFIGGLDVRRMEETSPAGVLLRGQDGHITRGGDFEQRAAFVPEYELPPGTVGMAHMRTGIVVFGSDPEPDMPVGISYQQLVHPEATADLIDVTSYDLYSGKIYATGLFSDGTTHHFYDGVRVEDWFDGRARAAFTVTGGGVQEAIAAQGSFRITGGTSGVSNEITQVQVNGVTITSGPVAHTGDDETTAAAVAADIETTVSSPNYSANAIGDTVYIIASTAGAASNGFAIVATVDGDVTVDDETALAGGANAGTSILSAVRVNGVDIMLADVEWSGSNSDTAEAIATAINASLTSPEYTALSDGPTVVILAADQGTAVNDTVVDFTTALGFTISPATGLVMAGGAAVDDTYAPGNFVKTIGAKVYSTSGPNMHFSGIQQPTQWTTDAVGAGFIDMSSYASGSEELTALAKYQNYVAVFAETAIQIWYVDPDPTLNRFVQDLNNTGTTAPQSVTKFGDNDLFYLNESGIRSLRARDSSNAASTTDIGVAIDPLVIAQLANMTSDDRKSVVGLVEPRDGRFWMVMKDKIFVLSFFSGGGAAGVSAWTEYAPGFDVEKALVFNKRVHLRSGDAIYVYGGLGNEVVYDDVEAIVRSPYLDGDQPTRSKTLVGVDAAVRGEWAIYAYMDPTDQDARDILANITKTTYSQPQIPGNGAFTHISVEFRSRGNSAGGPAKLGSFVVHFTSDESDDK